jgi:hypothetical protein
MIPSIDGMSLPAGKGKAIPFITILDGNFIVSEEAKGFLSSVR